MLSILRKERFVLLIGENGAILSLFVGKKLEKRLFAAGTSVGDRRDFNALLQKYPQAPLSILLDVMDQNFSQQVLPAVSALAVEKLVKKRIERDFDPQDINGAIALGRESGGRKDWKYLLVSVTKTETLSEWIDYAASLLNPLQGIFLLPIETGSLVKRLPLVDKEGKAEPTDWHLIVSHHKISGIRQTVVHKGKTIFSRLIMPGKENMPELLAGYIEQETSNTVEYLHRLSFNEDSKLNITMVVSDDIKHHLGQSRNEHHYVEVLTPNEISKAFGFSEISEETDKFADIFFAAQFLNARHALKMHTPLTKKMSLMAAGVKYSTWLMMLCVPLITLASIYVGVQSFMMNSDIKKLEDEKASIESKWKAVQESSDYDIGESTRITDLVHLHEKLLEAVHSPNGLFLKLRNATASDAVVKGIQWDFDQSFDAQQKVRGVSAKFDLEFLNKGTNIDELFNNFEAFSRRLKREFKDFEVTHTKLPEKITLGEQARTINMQVTISNKLKEEGR